MAINSEPRVPAYDELLTGHFREGRAFRTVRALGTADWLMILTLNGQGRFGHAPRGETVVGPGEIVLIQPGTKHDYGVASGYNLWEIVWAHFLPRPYWLPWLRWPEIAPGLKHLRLEGSGIQDRVARRFVQAHQLTRAPLSGSDLFAMNAIEEVLLWCRTLCHSRGDTPTEPRVEAIQQYIRHHLSEGISLDGLAAQCGLSVSRLSQLFRLHTGATPTQYVETMRMQRARNLLSRTSQSVGRIAEEVGFDNPFYFTLRFKRATGLSPTAFRKQADERSDG